jgi:mono/diheme cytochrome c family protein
MKRGLFGLLLILAVPLWSQNGPAAKPGVARSKIVERGRQSFGDYCATCHGENATGGRGPDLIHSKKVLSDKRGEVIGPILQAGIPAKGMPALGLTKDQIAELVAFLHAQANGEKSKKPPATGHP